MVKRSDPPCRRFRRSTSPKTRFVLKKALEGGALAIIVVINKIDRPDARTGRSAERDL